MESSDDNPEKVDFTVHDSSKEELIELVKNSKIKRILILSWRDLDDVESGGSELHAHQIATRWAEAGLDVTFRSSTAYGLPKFSHRNGYRIIRKSGRYLVFPRTALSWLVSASGHYDAVVEIWNGMPFFSTLWASKPKVVVLHHVHADMWQMVLPPFLAKVGNIIEEVVAPIIFRKEAIITPSESVKSDVLNRMKFKDSQIKIVHPGMDPFFYSTPDRNANPTVIAVGRLVPVKRVPLLIEILKEVKKTVPDLRAIIVGDGFEKEIVIDSVNNADATSWIALKGRVSDQDLLELYRNAWLHVSASSREGWGLTVLEAGGSYLPSVTFNIPGFMDSVIDGVSGYLAQDPNDMAVKIEMLLKDTKLREKMGAKANEFARKLTWDHTSLGIFKELEEVSLSKKR
ncbi:MAG: glycosyltransferase family 4 protein [Acidimicrobiales bacterium]|nr:glycosyltransferase family 4 protein [Acidimicrobiales bacterium]